jgi:hypothetical protein
MLARLRELGMLRRDKDPSQDLVAELFASAADRMVCPACDHQGLTVTEAEDEWDDESWNAGRPARSAASRLPPNVWPRFPMRSDA